MPPLCCATVSPVNSRLGFSTTTRRCRAPAKWTARDGTPLCGTHRAVLEHRGIHRSRVGGSMSVLVDPASSKYARDPPSRLLWREDAAPCVPLSGVV